MDTVQRTQNHVRTGVLPIAAYYAVLLLIAISWTNRAMVEPPVALRLLFTLFFSVPLLTYRFMAPSVMTVFVTVRWFSVSPFGYLPGSPLFYFGLTALLTLIDIGLEKSKPRRFLQLPAAERAPGALLASSVGILLLLIAAGASNLINLVPDYSFYVFFLTALGLARFMRRRDDFRMMEIAFMVSTLCLSVYALIFREDFIVKDYVDSAVIERSFWTDPNYLGSVLAIGIVIALYSFLSRGKERLVFRAFYLVVVVSGFLVLGLIASRGAFVAAAVPSLYIVYRKSNSVKGLAFAAVVAAAMFVAFLSTDDFSGLVARMKSNDATGSERTAIWEHSLKGFAKSDLPLLVLGGGTDYCNKLCGKTYGMSVVSPHNNFLGILYDYGLLGLVAFSLLFILWFKERLHNVLALSLLVEFWIVCFTLVPTMCFPFCFLIVLFEENAWTRAPSVRQRDHSLESERAKWRLDWILNVPQE